MTKRLAVLLAVKAMIQAALPDATVLGLDNEGVPPDRIPDGGRIVVRAGDPSDPEVDLSPVTYNYQHSIPVEIAISRPAGAIESAEEQLDAMISMIATLISADRTLAGLVDWIDGYAPSVDDLFVTGADVAKSADLVLVATYSTTHPL